MYPRGPRRMGGIGNIVGSRRINNFQPYKYSGYPQYYQKPGVNWNSWLGNTQKTLNIINSALPIIYQVGPMVRNAGTMLRIYSELKKDEPRNEPSRNRFDEPMEPRNERQEQRNENRNNNGPTFFL